MNKLEEYKKNLSEKLWDENHPTEQRAVKQGFDAVIALDLPVKFHLWTQEQEGDKLTIDLADKDRWVITPEWEDLPKNVTTKELYQYWIDNILKIE